MISRGSEYVTVCYYIHGANVCQTVRREDAYKLRQYVKEQNGTVYHFNPV
jgi:hypothetical protein